jgi:hypothetical protein
MKIALCFIINYKHFVHKENIWKEWIEQNKNIINVYFYYSDITKIRSTWIMEHTIPPNYICPTSYFHVVPAYLSVMQFAYNHDSQNQWFCLLTDSCCPIISPKKFRFLFYQNYNKSIMNWRKAWWNIEFHKRANLHKVPEEMRLANDPWFVLKRENVYHCLQFIHRQTGIAEIIMKGGLANESLFAIILHCYKELDNVIAASSHITDWSRLSSTTSPHMFREANDTDIQFIERNLLENENAMFIRKVHPEFPDEVLRKYIYNFSREKEKSLVLCDPFFKKRIYFYFVNTMNIFNLYFMIMARWLGYVLPFCIIAWFYFTKEIVSND